VDCLEQALQAFGTPEIFNTDYSCQFTSEAFIGVLKVHGIVISMDGLKWGWLYIKWPIDNLKIDAEGN
jgi:hypothetical protein